MEKEMKTKKKMASMGFKPTARKCIENKACWRYRIVEIEKSSNGGSSLWAKYLNCLYTVLYSSVLVVMESLYSTTAVHKPGADA